MNLPLLVSVPHAGWRVPRSVRAYCALSEQEILRDGDGGAKEIYAIGEHVEEHATTQVARAIVDLNRAPDDFQKDGVVKTHTCWDEPVYKEPLPRHLVRRLIEDHHAPYHDRLRRLARADVLAGIDCHTMAASAPPEAPDPGERRPRICLSDGDGTTLPQAWFQDLADALEESFGFAPSRNEPFQGGYIIREHSSELPWVQLELSRGPWMSLDEKRDHLLRALAVWADRIAERVSERPARERRPRQRPGRGPVPPAPRQDIARRRTDPGTGPRR